VVGDLAKADEVMNRVFWIGVYPGLNQPMLDYISDTMKQLYERHKIKPDTH
jgi:CDP-6-deoxy-D-xylo-4-hexulose-3-dehydrase